MSKEEEKSKDESKYSLWGGRFKAGNDELMKLFNNSLPVDKRLWSEDLQGSMGWARAIHQASLISSTELDEIVQGLQQIETEWQTGEFVVNIESDEDIHTANERRLRELIGSTAQKLHTGRSRNDQVATDMRLWMSKHLSLLEQNLVTLLESLLTRAESGSDTLMPGYTHLQRAQPIRFAHLLLSYVCALDRDLTRLRQLRERVSSECPLGTGAIAGNPFNIDRNQLAKELGFSQGPTMNSIDSTASRDLVYEFLFVSSSVATALSKFAEDFIIYNTKEFSFVRLSDAYCTGSSLMPQKKNADSLELIRGKTGRLQGRLAGFLTTCKGLPTSYNKDLQEDKEALFDSYDTINLLIRIATGVIDTLTLNKERMLQALTVDMLATDLAYYLVRKGVPFRQAHGYSGECVSLAEKLGVSIDQLTLEQLKPICDRFESDVTSIYNFENSVEQYTSVGGTAKSAVVAQIGHFKAKYAKTS